MKIAWAIGGVLLFSSLGCSSSDSKAGGAGAGGAGSQGASCPPFTDLCSKVTAQDFTTACGASATSATSTDTEAGPSSPAQVSSCEYTGAGSAERLCFPDGPAAAQLFYDNERKPAGAQTTDEDLTGLGDKAFYRETIAINEAFVYVLKGNLLIDVSNSQVATAGGAKACLTELANQILAAK